MSNLMTLVLLRSINIISNVTILNLHKEQTYTNSILWFIVTVHLSTVQNLFELFIKIIVHQGWIYFIEIHLKQYYEIWVHLKCMFYILIYFKMQFILVMAKLNFQQPLFQSSVSHDPSNHCNMLICCSRHISTYYPCLKRLCCLMFFFVVTVTLLMII